MLLLHQSQRGVTYTNLIADEIVVLCERGVERLRDALAYRDCDREREEREGGESYKFTLYKEPDSIEVFINQGGALQNKCMITSHQLHHNDVHTGSRQHKSNNIMSYFILESTR